MEKLEEICAENRNRLLIDSDYLQMWELKAKLQSCEACRSYLGFGGYAYCRRER
jgi:hypothetical protein